MGPSIITDFLIVLYKSVMRIVQTITRGFFLRAAMKHFACSALLLLATKGNGNGLARHL